MLTNLLTNSSLLYRAGISLFLQSSVNTRIMIWRWNLVQFLHYFSVGNVISQTLLECLLFKYICIWVCSTWCCSLARLSRMQYTINLWKYLKPLGLRAFWWCRCLFAQKWKKCKYNQLARHVLCKCIVFLHFDKRTEQQDFLLFCAVILRDKEILSPWL